MFGDRHVFVRFIVTEETPYLSGLHATVTVMALMTLIYGLILSTDSVDAIEQTLSDKVSHLTYDVTTDTYTYVWRTDKGWANTCRQLVVKLNDGSTEHVANFQFVK